MFATVRNSLLPVFLLLALASASASVAAAGNDASIERRLVRMDVVDIGEAKAFEDARRAWVASARSGAGGPGFDHVWSGTDGGRTTYVMTSPLANYAELDTRRDFEGSADGKGGDAYADAPHVVQVWRRIDALSFGSAYDPSLNELTAGVARMEIIVESDPRKRAELVATWKDIAAGLAAQKYPLASVVYENRFVSGQLIRLWLAKDSTTLKNAPPLKTSLGWASGDRRARDLSVRVNQLTEMQRYFPIERRADLSTAAQ